MFSDVSDYTAYMQVTLGVRTVYGVARHKLDYVCGSHPGHSIPVSCKLLCSKQSVMHAPHTFPYGQADRVHNVRISAARATTRPGSSVKTFPDGGISRHGGQQDIFPGRKGEGTKEKA